MACEFLAGWSAWAHWAFALSVLAVSGWLIGQYLREAETGAGMVLPSLAFDPGLMVTAEDLEEVDGDGE